MKNNTITSTTIITNKDNKNGRALIFDWDKFFIGSAEYPEGPTGCIVFYFPDRNVNAVVDIKGGAAASILTNDLANGGVCMLDAIVLAGGSTLGLEAATGVAASIFKDRNYVCGWGNMPFVSGSVIFDWVNRNNHLYPDKNLGSAAYENAEPGKFLLGRCGAGVNAHIAKVFGMKYSSPGGQGGAVRTFGNIRIAVFTVINALGAVYDETGNMLHGYVDNKANIPVSETDLLFKMLPFNNSSKKNNLKGNTTLTVVITNANLNLYEMQLLARQMHNSFSEVIRPFGTAEDGDTLYFVSTKEVTIFKKDRYALLPHIGILATKVIKEAIYAAFD